MKKSKRASKSGATKLAGTDPTTRPRNEANFVQVRKSIANLVGNSAEAMVQELINAPKDGHLAPMKYLFEAVGLYPPTLETLPEPDESLACTLLRRLGIPTEPVVREEEEIGIASAKFTRAAQDSERGC